MYNEAALNTMNIPPSNANSNDNECLKLKEYFLLQI